MFLFSRMISHCFLKLYISVPLCHAFMKQKRATPKSELKKEHHHLHHGDGDGDEQLRPLKRIQKHANANLDFKNEDGKRRCEWCDTYKGASKVEYVKYHDEEWGVPVHEDRKLFEYLILEGAQAGLSWSCVLNKRSNYIKAFDNFEPAVIALYDDSKVSSLLSDPGIIRNKLKVKSAVVNAKMSLQIQKEFGSLDNYFWEFVDHKPIVKGLSSLSSIPNKSQESILISKDLIRRGFKFVGPTIIYAFMQAVGMVNDHVITCFRYEEINSLLHKK